MSKINEGYVITCLSDGKWRTMTDIAVVLSTEDVVELETAIRSAPPGTPDEDKMTTGFVVLITPIINRLTAEGKMEAKLISDMWMYCAPLVDSIRRRRMATDEEMMKPADTRSGINTMMLYRIIFERPGIDEDSLIEALEKCWRSGAELHKSYSANATYRGTKLALKPFEEVTPEEIHFIKCQFIRSQSKSVDNATKRLCIVDKKTVTYTLAAFVAEEFKA